MEQLETMQLFPTFLYAIEKPEFINQVRAVAVEALKGSEVKSPLYPMRMGDNIHMHPKVQDFARYTAVTAGNILTDQGYMTDGQGAYFESMWCQEHYAGSGMDQHTHPHVLMVGFYFLDVPKNSSIVNFFDPRAGKVATPLEEKDPKVLSYSSNIYGLEPKAGLLLFTNSWLPHAFTRHGNDEPLRFIHFNIGLAEHREQSNAEVI